MKKVLTVILVCLAITSCGDKQQLDRIESKIDRNLDQSLFIEHNQGIIIDSIKVKEEKK